MLDQHHRVNAGQRFPLGQKDLSARSRRLPTNVTLSLRARPVYGLVPQLVRQSRATDEPYCDRQLALWNRWRLGRRARTSAPYSCMLPFDSFSAMDHFEGTRPGHLLALFPDTLKLSLAADPSRRVRQSSTRLSGAVPKSGVNHAAGKLHLMAALMFFLGPRTATENNAQRTDSRSLPQLCCRFGLQRGREPDTAHNFYGRLETSSVRCGRRCLSIASSVN
jgi:hypothetical protein